MYIIVGLGNPGEEYANTRHNTGRLVLASFLKEYGGDLIANKKLKALTTEGKIGGEKFTLIFPETFMNKSGLSVAPIVKSKKAAEHLIVVYDDLDLPTGKLKISFDRGSGGHRGLESIIKAVKTTAFIRIRVGISPTTPSGKTKKPMGEAVVEKHILGKFNDKETLVLKKQAKIVKDAVETIMSEGRDVAMTEFN